LTPCYSYTEEDRRNLEKSGSPKKDEKIGHKDVSYDVKGTVRDVLR
jgi:hypothetical protein